jgi:hypothetical protein
MGKHFGDTFASCGHCNYCVTKETLTIRHVPVLPSKADYSHYKEMFVTKSGNTSSVSPKQERKSDEECHLDELGVKWTYDPYHILAREKERGEGKVEERGMRKKRERKGKGEKKGIIRERKREKGKTERKERKKKRKQREKKRKQR